MASHLRRIGTAPGPLLAARPTRADWAAAFRTPRAWVGSAVSVAVSLALVFLIHRFVVHADPLWVIAFVPAGFSFGYEAQRAARRRSLATRRRVASLVR